ncbi:MAG TPA: glutamate synthase subunit beta [Gemmatimonadaceae bacterium]|nr:glutamate synthase subunit beta [Gemmatimonadaceae bacterium]
MADRIRTWTEFYEPPADDTLRAQGARCMDCGVPFCQGDTGCPVRNLIPEWNELVSRGRWRDALAALHATNNFPELTGRLCPAPCESACVLGLIDRPVAIRSIEQAIADRGFQEGWIAPERPVRESGRRVAVVGSGPAGLAAAQQLRRSGHGVVVLERADRIGGLLRYGIPDFKLEKRVLDARLRQLAAEGVQLETCARVDGAAAARLLAEFDAVLIAIGAGAPRELEVPGRELRGVHRALDFLEQQNRRVAGDVVPERGAISARGRRVAIIGGGDTGSDCLGTCHRQGATEVHQLELLPEPPAARSASTPWPLWPMQLRTSHAHEEGGRRAWSTCTVAIEGRGRVERLRAVRVEMRATPDGRWAPVPVPGEERVLDVDLVLLAMGYTGVVREGLVEELGLALDARGNIVTDERHMTSVPGVFAAGDARRGASLIVWAIREGRDAALGIDAHLGSGVAG